jgi:hypothetical protein
MSALCQKRTSGYFGSTFTCCSTTTGRVKLRPTVWAIEVVKWRQTATAAQRTACTAASEGVTLNYH